MGEKKVGTYIGKYDPLKGILMLLIILGHSVTDYYRYWDYDYSSSMGWIPLFFVNAILLYGMIPLFFMICAYGGRPRPIKSYTKSLLRSFVKPYAVMVLGITAGFAIKNFILQQRITYTFKYNVLPYFLGKCPGGVLFGLSLGSIGPVWFFLVYISAGILLNLVMHEKERWIQVTLIIAMAVLGILMKDVSLPFCIQQTLVCCGFMYVGNLIRKNNLVKKKLPTYWLLLMLAIFYIVAFNSFFKANNGIEISQNVYPNGFADLFASYCAGILLYLLIDKLDFIYEKIPNFFRWIGVHSLWICCIHTVAYTVIPWSEFAEYWSDNQMVGFALELCLNLVIALGGCKLIEIFGLMRKQLKWKRSKKSF